MEDMEKHPRLAKRNGSDKYYFRAKIPADLQDHFGKKEVMYSLRTPDRQEALKRCRVESLKFDQECEEARRTMNAVELQELSQVEIERLAAIAYHDEMLEDATKRTQGMSDSDHADYSELLQTLDFEFSERLAKGDTKDIEGYADELLASQGVSLDKASEGYKALLMRLLESFAKATQDMRDRQRGQVIPTPPKPAAMSTAMTYSLGATPTITEVHGMWAKEHLAGGGPEKTVTDFLTHVRRFAELHGDMPIGEITKAHVRDYKDAMLRLPARLTSKLKGMTVPKVLEYAAKHPDIQTLSPRTVNDKSLGAIGAVLGWAEENAYIEHNPASRVKVKGAKVSSTVRLPYTVEDMNEIFQWSVHANGERPVGGAGVAAYWMPLIAIFTGARREEIGQLSVEDIKEERGVIYFDMTNVNDGQRRKTESSKRRVPIHSQLIKLGLLPYANEVGKGYLFPLLKDAKGQRTEAFGKWWRRYTRKNGIPDPLKVFHSFRHAAKDGFREGGVEEQISDALTGHAPMTEGRKYGSDAYPITRLKEGIEMLAYPGLDLSHLLQNKQAHNKR
jgi:integrase